MTNEDRRFLDGVIEKELKNLKVKCLLVYWAIGLALAAFVTNGVTMIYSQKDSNHFNMFIAYVSTSYFSHLSNKDNEPLIAKNSININNTETNKGYISKDLVHSIEEDLLFFYQASAFIISLLLYNWGVFGFYKKAYLRRRDMLEFFLDVNRIANCEYNHSQ